MNSLVKPFTASLWLIILLSACVVACGPPPAPQESSAAYEFSVVVRWNEVALSAIRSNAPKPTVVSRALYMLHAAMYDAWSTYDPTAVPTTDMLATFKQPRSAHTLANKEEAVSYAAFYMLQKLYPQHDGRTGEFSQLMLELGYNPSGIENLDSPARIGWEAAQAVFLDRVEDGSNMLDRYEDVTSEVYPTLYAPANSPEPGALNSLGNEWFNPNRWQPLRIPTGSMLDEEGNPAYLDERENTYTDQLFLTPHWGAVRPVAMEDGSQFRPPPPPQYGSDLPYTDGLGRTMTNEEAYISQFSEVLLFSSSLDDTQKVIAEYWADGPRSETPPGHWNALSHGISWRDQHTLDEDIKLYFALNCAILDASIAAWEAKRAFDFVRPQTAIRYLFEGETVLAWAGPDKGIQEIPVEEWRPYQDLTFVTPPFAEYVSGHSAFSAASAAVLTAFTGSDQYYDGVTQLPEDFNSDGIPDMLGQHIVYPGGNMFENSPATQVTLTWPTFWDAADEAGISRLYGGIHIQDGDLRGRTLGRQVGELAYVHAEAMWNGQAP